MSQKNRKVGEKQSSSRQENVLDRSDDDDNDNNKSKSKRKPSRGDSVENEVIDSKANLTRKASRKSSKSKEILSRSESQELDKSHNISNVLSKGSKKGKNKSKSRNTRNNSSDEDDMYDSSDRHLEKLLFKLNNAEVHKIILAPFKENVKGNL